MRLEGLLLPGLPPTLSLGYGSSEPLHPALRKAMLVLRQLISERSVLEIGAGLGLAGRECTVPSATDPTYRQCTWHAT